MSDMERVLRDEIAWHEVQIEMLDLSSPAQTVRIKKHRARLAVLTAALPAPGDWVMVPREVVARLAGGAKGPRGGRVVLEVDLMALDDALSAAPHPPVSPGEISQAQAQAMREALRNLLTEAGYMARQLADRGLPGVAGDSVDRALDAAKAALAAVPAPAA